MALTCVKSCIHIHESWQTWKTSIKKTKLFDTVFETHRNELLKENVSLREGGEQLISLASFDTDGRNKGYLKE